MSRSRQHRHDGQGMRTWRSTLLRSIGGHAFISARRGRKLVLLAVLSAACLGAAPAAAQAELVVNGGFETGTTGSWTQLSNGVDVVDTSFFASHSGTYSTDLNSSAPGGITQTLATTPGQQYTLSFWMAGNPDPFHNFCSTDGLTYSAIYQLNVSWDGTVLDSPVFDNSAGVYNAANMGWTQHSYTVTATTSSTPLEFDSVTPTGACGPTIDDVSVVSGNNVNAVAPGAIAQAVSNLPVKITGSGWFSTPATVSASDPGITFTKLVVKSPTLITAKASATAGVPVGTYDVTVNVGAVSQICTGCLQVLAQPTVSSIAPDNLGQGASKVLVTITGSDFYAPAKVTFRGPGTGVTGAVKSISPDRTTMSVAVTVRQGAILDAYTLNLKNGDGGVASCVCLTVAVGPTITSFTPSSVARHHTTPFTVTGTGFSSDATLKGPSGVKFSNLSVTPDKTTITATMTVSATAPTGTNLPITVRNGPIGNYGAITDMALTITP